MAGVSTVTGAQFDGAGRETVSYVSDGGGDTTWTDATNVTGDNVLSQVESTYDKDSKNKSACDDKCAETWAPVKAHDKATNMGDWTLVDRGKGYMQWAYKQAGITLPRTAAQQHQFGAPVPRDQLQPGDLVAYYSPVSHIGMYIGDGMMVHEPDTGEVAKVSPLQSNYAGASRPTA